MVQTCNVNLDNANHRLLGKALERLGYRVVRDSTGKILSFSKVKVTGTYNGKTLNLSGTTTGTNEIMREYSRQVILKRGEEAQRKGWDFVKEGDRYVVRKPQGRQAKVYA